jgi:hypothetical protein
MTTRRLVFLLSTALAAGLGVFACVGGDVPGPGAGEPCGSGCGAGLACVNDVCTATGGPDSATGDTSSPTADGAQPDGGASQDAASDVLDVDACAYLPVATPGTVVCPVTKCLTSTQKCCANAGGGVKCNDTCTFRSSPVLLGCDGPDDCAAGAVCCLRQTKASAGECPRVLSYDSDASVNASSSVTTECTAPAECIIRTCNAAAGCPAGQACVPGKLPTGDLIGYCE